jgi:hypothetical protein
MEESDQLSSTIVLSPGIHWIAGWVGPRAGMKAVTKKTHIPAGNRIPALYSVTVTFLTEQSRTF